jgi:F-type H+-transporting ATPase subunit delta
MAKRLENSKIASRYAKALFESVSASGEIEKVATDLQAIADILTQVPDFNRFIENPVIPVEDKIRFAEQQVFQQVNPWVGRIITLLLKNNRMPVFPQLVEHFINLLNQRENVAQAEVITAVELEAELRARIQKTLESTFGFQRVDLSHRVDPGLLGGAIVKIQDQVIDGSYVGRLEALRKQIAKA